MKKKSILRQKRIPAFIILEVFSHFIIYSSHLHSENSFICSGEIFGISKVQRLPWLVIVSSLQTLEWSLEGISKRVERKGKGWKLFYYVCKS